MNYAHFRSILEMFFLYAILQGKNSRMKSNLIKVSNVISWKITISIIKYKSGPITYKNTIRVYVKSP